MVSSVKTFKLTPIYENDNNDVIRFAKLYSKLETFKVFSSFQALRLSIDLYSESSNKLMIASGYNN
ncbi:CLUMA_CG015692, isoform A [Clunio marinus]|uniref:CLUMA_CG015692, isoform A n=1 Tax=Clunio marinus TaxID=568069 RepID=A0A1J1IR72_9DIPT|nr:CLUMA_CG015692, isoform A [Clunio marinus]